MAENRPAVETSKVPEFKPKGFRARLEQFVNRVDHFIHGAEKLEAVVDLTPKPVEAPTEAGNKGGGLMERLGRKIDHTAEKLTDGVKGAYEAVATKVEAAGDRLRSTGEEIKSRRAELGIKGTVRSYADDLNDRVTAVESKVKARWESAKVADYAEQRQKINDRYLNPEQRKEYADAGKEFPKDAILNREALREALKPLRAAELASRRGARELREVAKECYRRVEKKQNAKDVLTRAKAAERTKWEQSPEGKQILKTSAKLAEKYAAKQGD